MSSNVDMKVATSTNLYFLVRLATSSKFRRKKKLQSLSRSLQKKLSLTDSALHACWLATKVMKCLNCTVNHRSNVTVEILIFRSVVSLDQKKTMWTTKTCIIRLFMTFTATAVLLVISTMNQSSITSWFSAWAAKTGSITLTCYHKSSRRSCQMILSLFVGSVQQISTLCRT